MLFNSIEYALFFGAVFSAFALLRGRWPARKWLLLASSYLFYAAWNPPFVALLAFSTGLDHVAARRIEASDVARVRRAWLCASLAGNLGVLAFFKYAGFALGSVWPLLPDGFAYPAFLEDVVLPVGISFYTFQSLSYTIDVYRREIATTRSLLDLAVFVSFFPQLVAGPIVRARDFLPQLVRPRHADAEDGLRGVEQIARGFAKKVVIADGLGAYVDVVFANPGSFGAVNTWLAVYAYAFQIYCDFSGYSDIAIGTARLMGLRIPRNFDLPYLSRNPREFWRRWHISLSSWLRDYLYVPLGGSRSTRLRTARNLAITMLLGGLWHGAAWNFVLWGAYHATWLVVHRFAIRDRAGASDRRRASLPSWIARVATFHLVCLGWLLFRSESLADIGTHLAALVDVETTVYAVSPWTLALLAVAFASHGIGASNRWRDRWEAAPAALTGFAYALVVAGVFLCAPATAGFIYFQF